MTPLSRALRWGECEMITLNITRAGDPEGVYRPMFDQQSFRCMFERKAYLRRNETGS